MHDFNSFLVRENVTIFRAKIKEFEELLRHEQADLYSYCNSQAHAFPEQVWQWRWLIANTEKRIQEYEKQIKRFAYLKRICTGHEKKKSIDIQAIKENTNIEDVLGNAKKKLAHTLTFICPFHNEKNPSFVWYKKQNSGHCFSCGKHGDVIDIAMTLWQCDFVSACKKLS